MEALGTTHTKVPRSYGRRVLLSITRRGKRAAIPLSGSNWACSHLLSSQGLFFRRLGLRYREVLTHDTNQMMVLQVKFEREVARNGTSSRDYTQHKALSSPESAPSPGDKTINSVGLRLSDTSSQELKTQGSRLSFQSCMRP